MTATKIPYFKNDNQASVTIGQSRLAVVSGVVSGQATRILVQNSEDEIKVVGHAAEISTINITDYVVVLIVEGGAIVLHRLRRNGEHPQSGFTEKEDGTLYLNSKNSVIIETDHIKFEINADGRIKLDGKEIYSVSKGMQYVSGSQLNLN